MKYIFALIFSLFFITPALADNTYSLQLQAVSSQYAYASDSVSLSQTGDLTIQAWCKFTAGAYIHSIIQKVGNSGGTNFVPFYFYYYDSSHVLYAMLGSSDNAGHSDTWAFTPTAETWYHIAFVYDASEGSVEAFVDATSLGVKTGFTNSLYNSSGILAIGQQNSENRYYLNGKIDDVRLYNTARSQANIEADYEKELIGDESGLVAYWKLNNTGFDETANNNDLTLINSPTYSDDVPFVGGEPPVEPTPTATSTSSGMIDTIYYTGFDGTSTTTATYFIPFLDYLLLLYTLTFTILVIWFSYWLVLQNKRKT